MNFTAIHCSMGYTSYVSMTVAILPDTLSKGEQDTS